jgi:hypothetical protein
MTKAPPDESDRAPSCVAVWSFGSLREIDSSGSICVAEQDAVRLAIATARQVQMD